MKFTKEEALAVIKIVEGFKKVERTYSRRTTLYAMEVFLAYLVGPVTEEMAHEVLDVVIEGAKDILAIGKAQKEGER